MTTHLTGRKSLNAWATTAARRGCDRLARFPQSISWRVMFYRYFLARLAMTNF
jgi:hypothetical protein